MGILFASNERAMAGVSIRAMMPLPRHDLIHDGTDLIGPVSSRRNDQSVLLLTYSATPRIRPRPYEFDISINTATLACDDEFIDSICAKSQMTVRKNTSHILHDMEMRKSVNFG